MSERSEVKDASSFLSFYSYLDGADLEALCLGLLDALEDCVGSERGGWRFLFCC